MTCFVDFVVVADHIVKIKESEMKKKKSLKNWNSFRELKKRWHMRVTLTIIVIGVLGMVTKELQERRNWKSQEKLETAQKIVGIGWDTEMIPENMRGLVFT